MRCVGTFSDEITNKKKIQEKYGAARKVAKRKYEMI